jgi:uncharacterized membrane protein YqiK
LVRRKTVVEVVEAEAEAEAARPKKMAEVVASRW